MIGNWLGWFTIIMGEQILLCSIFTQSFVKSWQGRLLTKSIAGVVKRRKMMMAWRMNE